MICLTCGEDTADELNVSMNTSEAEGDINDVDTIEYGGSTEYGDVSSGIGTYCTNCGETYLPDAEADAIGFLFGQNTSPDVASTYELLTHGIVLHMDGGIVHSATCNGKAVPITVVAHDHDTEGADEDRLVTDESGSYVIVEIA